MLLRAMNVLCYSVLLLRVACASEINVLMEQADELQRQVEYGKPVDDLFQQYKHIYRKSYKLRSEEQKRKMIFQDNLEYIRRHNERYNNSQTSYRLGLNEFADLSHQEFVDMYTSRMPIRQRQKAASNMTMRTNARTILPMTVDWRGQGYVTPIKAQGVCGGCWAFVTAGSIEGQLWRRTKQLVSLSVQQLVDCSKQNGGCTNGFVDVAYTYVEQAGGLEKDDDYPYEEEQKTCRFDRRKIVAGSRVHTFMFIPSENEQAMKDAVATIGPVAASFDAKQRSFQLYTNGVYDEPNCSSYDLDHGGLVVGYGDHPQPYWLVKNSWGPTWGESGYIRMARNKNNQCGIATDSLYPVLG